MLRFLRHHPIIASAVIVIGIVGGLAWWYYRSCYPYGWSHCCELCLSSALDEYAEKHGGQYPTGGATPEGSLSLLYPDHTSAEILRGKTVAVGVVQSILDRGERLGPESCGWHYVEGLTTRDSPRAALFWDKAGLSHNGRRLPEGGHQVFFVGLFKQEYIPGDQWPAFLEEQAKLHAGFRQAGRNIRSSADSSSAAGQ